MTSLPSIIGITGRKFNGKDTVGNILIEKYGYTRIAFADPLKRACEAIFHFTNEQLYGSEKEKLDDFWKVTPRTVMQFVGTEMFREQIHKIIPNVGDNIWIKSIEKEIKNTLEINKNAKFVVTDVRFNNECEVIKTWGGKVIRVTRPSINNTLDMHESELNISSLDVDYDLLNDSTITNLENNLDNLLSSL